MPTKTKKSTNPIPLSMRGKKRYIKLRLLTDKKLNEADVSKALLRNALQLFGEIGIARQRFQFMDFNAKTNCAVVRCANDSLEEVKAGLLFLQSVNSIDVIPRIELVSGSISKLLN